MTAPILLPDVHKRSEATSRPQNFTRSHLSPKIMRTREESNHQPLNLKPFGAHPGYKDNATSIGLLVLWQKRDLPFHPSAHKKPPAPTTPQHTEGKSKTDLDTSGFCPTSVQKNSLEQSSTQQLQETELRLLLLCWLTPLQTNKWQHAFIIIHSSHNAQSCKANGVSSRLKL